MGWVRSTASFLSWVLAFVIIIAVILKIVFFDVAVVGHNGMAPTLLRGERILINKKGKLEVGNIAVCKHPTEEGYVVGRIAAKPGSWITSKGPTLDIDGTKIEYKRHGATTFYNPDIDKEDELEWGSEYYGPSAHRIFMAKTKPKQEVRRTLVQDGKLYLLGDYRAYMGQDSRVYGPVDEITCRGTIMMRLTPVDGLNEELKHGYFELIL